MRNCSKEEFIGKKFSQLEVVELELSMSFDKKKRVWKCLCDCGKITFATSSHLKSKFKKKLWMSQDKYDKEISYW